MRRILALMALVVALAACQKEKEQMDVVVGGEVDMVVNVNVPSSTRAGSEKGIFESGLLDGEAKTMRYILQVFYTDENNKTHKTTPQTKYTNNSNVAFNVRLTPNRDYTFVVWADVVEGVDAGDWHYNTTDLNNITIIDTDTANWVAMDETRDAFTATHFEQNFTSSSVINIPLRRPNAKLRVKTTDWDTTAGMPTKARVTYKTEHRTAFNAYTGEVAKATLEAKEHTYTIDNTYGESDTERTLFCDYFFASEDGDEVEFNMELLDGNDTKIKVINFNTEIPVKRNHLTTIQGNLLSSGEGDSTITEN